MKYLDQFDHAKCHGHEGRFALSLTWIESLLVSGALVYDFGQNGGDNPFNQVLARLFPVSLHTTGEADLRHRLPIADATADGCTVMETLEHVKDRVEDPVDVFTYSGIRNCLAEACRILKPGGWMFLSTPNACQYGTIWRLVRGEASNWCLAHLREFGWCELQQFVTEAGFRIERIEAVTVWDPLECPHVLKAVVEHLAPDVPRGDCIFLLARKPEARP